MTRARNLSGLSTVTGQPTTTTPVNLGPLGVGTFARIYGTWEQDQINTVSVAATNLQVSGITTGLNVSGIITAQNGLNVTGNIVNGLNVSAGIATFAGAIDANGNVDIAGNLTVAGTATYEDLTDIDSIGVGTFRKGIIVAGVSTFSDSVKANGSVYVQGNPAEVRIQHTGNGSYSRLISNSSNELNIYTGGGPSLAMTIDGSQEVGIGTASPSRPVHINKNSAAVATVRFTNQNAGISTGADVGLTAGGDVALWHGDGKNLILGTSNLERARITSGGAVGINTSVPSTAQYLTIDGESNYKAGIFFKQAGVDQYRVMCEGGTGAIYHDAFADGGDFIFRTNTAASGGTERLRITEEGIVQIGSSNNTGANTKLVVGSGNNINTTAIINTGDVDVDALTLSNWDGSTTTNKLTIHFDSSGIGGWNIGMPAATDAFVVEDDGGDEKLKVSPSGDTLLVTGTVRGDAYQSMRLGNTNTTSVSDHYWKIGEATMNGSEGFTLEIDTGCGYSAGGSTVAHTTCVARAMNNTTLEGYWYSTSMAGAAGVKDIRWKYTGANNIYEIWVKANQYANISPIVKLHGGTWTAFNTNTGASSVPASSTAFNNGTHYTQIDGYNTIQYNQQNTTFLGDIKMADGKGIDFSLDGNAGGMTSEILDDYEEGTWTPTFTAGSANGTFTKGNATGTYTKVGRFVYLQYYTGTITTLSGFSGQAYVSNLPFTSANTGYNYPAVVPVHTTCFTAAPVGYISNNSSIIVWLDHGSTTAGNEWNNTNTTYLMFSCSYEAT